MLCVSDSMNDDIFRRNPEQCAHEENPKVESGYSSTCSSCRCTSLSIEHTNVSHD